MPSPSAAPISYDAGVQRISLSRVLEPLLALALLGLVGCGRPGDDVVTDELAQMVCPRGGTLEGIDVSTYQGMIDWPMVAASGRKYAIARIGDGLGRDATFPRNWQGIKDAGMIRGAYQYFRPNSDPVAQADIVIAAVGRLGQGDLPVTCDVEASTAPDAATYVANLHTWIDRVQAATGKAPIIYTGFYYWRDRVGGSRDFAAHPLWHAQYTSAACPNIADAWTDWAFWQYSSTGTVPGISGNVDLDRFNGTMEDLVRLAGGGEWGAEFVGQSFPTASTGAISLHAGESAEASIELRNIGTRAWDAQTRLGTTEPRDRADPFAGPEWSAPNRLAGVPAGMTVAPGATHRFTWRFHAPRELAPGRYDEHFGVVQEGVAWFSDAGQAGPPDQQLEAIIEVLPARALPDGGVGGRPGDGAAGSPARDAGATPDAPRSVDAAAPARDGAGGNAAQKPGDGGCASAPSRSGSWLLLALGSLLAARRRRPR